MTTREQAAHRSAAVIWHEAECGGYAADLPVWRALAAGHPGPVLDLGAGTGRVAFDLASRGHHVVAVDDEGELIGSIDRRAATEGLPVEPVCADVRELALERRFGLVIAPMQLLHLLGGREGRARALNAVARHLLPGGVFAATLLVEPLPPSGRPEALPDVREVDGWIYSSLPLEVSVDDSSLELVRLRQRVSPEGDLDDVRDVIHLDRVSADALAAEASAAGLTLLGTAMITETDQHVASVLLVIGLDDA